MTKIDWEAINAQDLVSRACSRRAAALEGTDEADAWERYADAAYGLTDASVAGVLREHMGENYGGLRADHLRCTLDDDDVLDALAVVMTARGLCEVAS